MFIIINNLILAFIISYIFKLYINNNYKYYRISQVQTKNKIKLNNNKTKKKIAYN